MKQFKLSSLALVLLIAVMPFMQSCESDPCESVVCENDGTATATGDECECVCVAGYEGVNCELQTRARYAGVYAVNDACSASGAGTYSVTVGNGTAVTAVSINNFWGVFVNNVTATVSGDNITIARQEPDSDSFFVEGSGTISGNVITWSYKITDESQTPIGTDNCTATWTK